jgi:hypothetical protein
MLHSLSFSLSLFLSFSLFSFFSLGSRQNIDDSDSTEFYKHRVIVKDGSIKMATVSTLSKTGILCVWIPDSIIFLNWYRTTGRTGIGKESVPLKSIVFESNSRLTRIGSEILSQSSLQSILIPSNVEILESKYFYRCKSLSSIIFELN